MPQQSIVRWGFVPLWLLLTTTIFFRNPMPIDETRYLSVAWEMWLRGDFLVPYLNGHTYSHKPPLLFWLFELGWGVFGVNEWWPRLVGPLAALLNLLMLRRLAAKLWPAHQQAALTAPWFLIATLLWTLFATSTMFDILLTCCVLLGMMGLVEVTTASAVKGWSYFALAIGLGLLAKGPVIFLHLLPTAALVYIWQPSRQNLRWFGGLIAATLAGCAIALCWALPAAAAGGEEYASAILWHQTADRTVGTKIHARGFYWYLLFLPMLIFPWISWPRLWQNLRQPNIFQNSGLRFSLTWLLSTLVIFSILPSKQLHYLIPMLPAFALVCSYLGTLDNARRSLSLELIPAGLMALTGLFLIVLPQVPGLAQLNWVQTLQPTWGLCVVTIAVSSAAWTLHFRETSVITLSASTVSAVFVGLMFFFQYTGLQYNLQPAADKLKRFNDQQIATAFVGDYQGQLNFLGRLTQALPVISSAQAPAWAEQHPQGYLISLEKTQPAQADYVQAHREYWLIFRNSQQASSKWHGQSEKISPTADNPLK